MRRPAWLSPPVGGCKRSEDSLTSREDLRRHFSAGADTTATVRFRPDAVVVHETRDPEVIVAELEYRGTVLATGEPYAVPCVFVMRVRDGRIVESRDYIDHVSSARARGQLDQLLAAVHAADAP